MLNEIYKRAKAVFLAHGYVGETLGKTINGVLMHSKLFEVVSLIDKYKVGEDTSKICKGVNKSVPIVACFEDSLPYSPEVLILMEEPSEKNHETILKAIRKRIDIINPGFTSLKENKELCKAALFYGTRLIDLRFDFNPPNRLPDGSILSINAKVVLVTGTDCGLGKRTAAYELYKEAKRRGINAAFAATGQTGILLGCDEGIVFDSITTNFSAGAVEQMIVKLDNKGFELIFVEGQASLMHFGGSTVITLLHASNPHAILMVHDISRKMHAAYGNSPIFKMIDYRKEIEITESLSLPEGNQFKVVGIPTIGHENVIKLQQETNLAVADARTLEGPGILLDAVLEHLEKTYKWVPKHRYHKELLYKG